MKEKIRDQFLHTLSSEQNSIIFLRRVYIYYICATFITQLENAVRGMGFAHVSIFRPGLLDRGAARRGTERLACEICSMHLHSDTYRFFCRLNHVNCIYIVLLYIYTSARLPYKVSPSLCMQMSRCGFCVFELHLVWRQ